MRALIVEDKEYIRKGLVNLLDEVGTDIQILGECESVHDAVVVAKSCKPDLVFLDINLLDGTAFDFLEQTRDLSFKVIFITAYEEYALRALKIGAVDYLLKPVELEELKVALQKVQATSLVQQKEQIEEVQNAWKNPDNKIVLSLHDSFQVVDLKKLIYCRSDKGYTFFHCVDNKKYVVSKTIKEFEEQLTRANFVRPHQSYIINLDFVDKYDKAGDIHMINGEKIPVSVRKKESFLSRLLKR